MQVQTKMGSATSPTPGERGVIIAHLANSVGAWGAGFVLAINKLSLAARDAYRALAQDNDGNIPLGTTQFVEIKPSVFISNMIAQDGVTKITPNDCLVSYGDLEICLRTTFDRAVRLRCDIHIPAGVGSGLAGGNKTRIMSIIQKVADLTPDSVTNPIVVTLWEFNDTSSVSYVRTKPTHVDSTLDSIFDTE